SHAVRSSVLSIILGSALKLPPFRLIELGAAAVLHEIGMIKLPPQLYMAGRQLSTQERKAITAHPVLGYNILKEKQVPLAVCLSALEHHERLNGTGYPRGLTGDKISLYSRIIMVACSYDAVTSNRPYKEAKEGYVGMVDILKNDGKQYDENVIRALVYSLSIYPIGSHVLLTNGKKALVVDVNPDNPRYPVVQVVGAKTPDGKEVVVATSETGIRILRPLTKEEALALREAAAGGGQH
ncbi:MAG: HD-GYP domain-containing protein, partial [Spirochaetaceae bacterium]|nr:HD-GYP domain-containing protein [Spirochaetaceae bacterium]